MALPKPTPIGATWADRPRPEPGSVVLCTDCVTPSVFDGDMNLRQLTDADRPVKFGRFWGFIRGCRFCAEVEP
jgi:hypothetical protein